MLEGGVGGTRQRIGNLCRCMLKELVSLWSFNCGLFISGKFSFCKGSFHWWQSGMKRKKRISVHMVVVGYCWSLFSEMLTSAALIVIFIFYLFFFPSLLFLLSGFNRNARVQLVIKWATKLSSKIVHPPTNQQPLNPTPPPPFTTTAIFIVHLTICCPVFLNRSGSSLCSFVLFHLSIRRVEEFALLNGVSFLRKKQHASAMNVRSSCSEQIHRTESQGV